MSATGYIWFCVGTGLGVLIYSILLKVGAELWFWSGLGGVLSLSLGIWLERTKESRKAYVDRARRSLNVRRPQHMEGLHATERDAAGHSVYDMSNVDPDAPIEFESPYQSSDKGDRVTKH